MEDEGHIPMTSSDLKLFLRLRNQCKSCTAFIAPKTALPIPSSKLTLQWNITMFNRKYKKKHLHSWSILPASHVSLPEGKIFWLVVEPTHLKNMSQDGFIFPKFRDGHKKSLKPPPSFLLSWVLVGTQTPPLRPTWMALLRPKVLQWRHFGLDPMEALRSFTRKMDPKQGGEPGIASTPTSLRGLGF